MFMAIEEEQKFAFIRPVHNTYGITQIMRKLTDCIHGIIYDIEMTKQKGQELL